MKTLLLQVSCGHLRRFTIRPGSTPAEVAEKREWFRQNAICEECYKQMAIKAARIMR